MSDKVLPECEGGVSEIRVDVGILQHEVATHEKVLGKITEAVEKFQEMNANVVRLISLHDLRHDAHEKFQEETDEDMKDLNVLLERKIDGLRAEFFEIARVKPTITTETSSNTDLKKTLRTLDRWIWMFIGGAAVLGWILAHLRWSALLQLFGG